MGYDNDSTHYDHFIGGEFVESSGDDRIDVEYPYNGDVWASVPDGTTADVDRAVRVAREAYSDWRTMGLTERRNVLYSVADAFDGHVDELADLETRQSGKLIREMKGQMGILGEWFRYYGSQIDTDRGDIVPVENKNGEMFTYVTHEPYGVVGAITPWNSPLLLAVGKLAPAIATGNTFVLKPSEITPVSALRLAEIVADETEVPDGVFNVVTGAGETGAALADHHDIDKLGFTGGTETGRKIGEAAGRNLNPVTLELGGKSANIIFSDADLENAVNGVIKGIFAATGQTCVAGSRVFVHESVFDEFLESLVEKTDEITVGDPLDPDTELGPLAFREQWTKVREYIDIAESEGATIAYGGDRPADAPGDCFFRPTILTDVENDMRVAQEEIFGPVASVITFSEEDGVIEQANDTRYGLAAGIWTESISRAHRVAGQMEAGVVWVNEYRRASHRAPMGGYKDSGVGRENGDEGLDEYRQKKTVWMDLAGEVSNPFQLN